jgi:ribonuclease III
VANTLLAIRLLFESKKKNYKELIFTLGFYPHCWELYELAFVHRSASVLMPDSSTVNNERLEFLGDAVLDAVVAEYLFKRYPDKDEGFLSKMRSKIVKRQHLNTLANKTGIDKFIVSNSINSNGGKYISGNAFEALIGAIYMDKGYSKTKDFLINNVLNKHINFEELEFRESDYKSRIIEWAQKNRNEIGFENQEEYTESGHSPTFVSRVLIDNRIAGEGRGTSKKEAEQNAAEQAYWTIESS